jgi:hypothetical protein
VDAMKLTSKSRGFGAARGKSARDATAAGAIWLAWAFGVCEYCRSERENLCRRAKFTGRDIDGGFASHVLLDPDFAVRIPDAFDDVGAAPLLCGGVIGYRALRLAGFGGHAPRSVRLRRLGLAGDPGRPAPRGHYPRRDPQRAGPEACG